jgi:hypothetical protein
MIIINLDNLKVWFQKCEQQVALFWLTIIDAYGNLTIVFKIKVCCIMPLFEVVIIGFKLRNYAYMQ